jgi:hypothetical protein
MSVKQLKAGWAEMGHVEMGKVISLYTLNCKSPDKKTEETAGILLDKIFQKVDFNVPVTVNDGLLGIGCGMIWLLRNGFVDGDEDEVLQEIDYMALHTIIFQRNGGEIDWKGLLYYLRKRISISPDKAGRLALLKNKQTILYLLDACERHLQSAPVKDPGILKELRALYRIGLFKNKIQRLISPRTDVSNKIRYKIDVNEGETVTFIIPLRVDSAEREENLSVVIDSLSRIKDARIIVLEANTFPRFKGKNRQIIQYHFIEDGSEVFHRTRYINLLLEMTQTPIVGVWDTDVIIPLNQIEKSIREIKEGGAAFSFPYDGCFYDVPPAISETFRRQSNPNLLKNAQPELIRPFGAYSVGGAFLVNKAIYRECGYENEHFYGWGAEDIERVKRMEIFGHTVHRTEGSLYHLYHPRDNSWYVNVEAQVKSLQELLHIANLSQQEIQEYVKTWG